MKKAYLKTFGCKVNQYESQLIQERYLSSGFQISDSYENADVAVINSCTVTNEADKECRQLIRRIIKRSPGTDVILTGCYVKRDAEAIAGEFPGIIVVSDKENIMPAAGSRGPSGITGFYDHSRPFVKIQDGCDAFCSYCIVPYVRPNLISRPEEDILAEIRDLSKRGYAEIVLSGIRLGKFIGGLTGLLGKIIALPGTFRIRLSSLEILEVSDDLLALMRSHRDKICWHLHVPLQSGTDRVLRDMNRPYDTSCFLKKLEVIRAALPEAGITTDVITGFPGETEKDFEITYKFIKKCAFSRLHIFKFSPRQGTPAADRIDKVPVSEVKERARSLKQLDSFLQDSFIKRFDGGTCCVVRESGSGNLISDNYIRITPADPANLPEKPVFPVKTFLREGSLMGIPV